MLSLQDSDRTNRKFTLADVAAAVVALRGKRLYAGCLASLVKQREFTLVELNKTVALVLRQVWGWEQDNGLS